MQRIILAALAALCVALVGLSTEAAHAEHPSEEIKHLRTVLSHKADMFGKINGSLIVAVNQRVVARNPIRHTDQEMDDPVLGKIPAGGAIPVCAEAKYKEATEKAIKMWNDGLPVEVFTFHSTNIRACPTNDRDVRNELSSIVVRGYKQGTGHCPKAGGCAIAERMTVRRLPDGTWTSGPLYGLLGRTTVWINNDNWDRNYDDASGGHISKITGPNADERKENRRRTGWALIAHELGHALGLAHPIENAPSYTLPRSASTLPQPQKVKGCPGDFYLEITDSRGDVIKQVLEILSSGKYGIKYTNTSGVKATFALNHPSKPDHGRQLYAAKKASLGGHLLLWNMPWCAGDTEITASNQYTFSEPGKPPTDTIGHWRYDSAPALRQYTKDIYRKVYNPSQVTNLRFKNVGTSQLTLTWDADHVHMEKDFKVQSRASASSPWRDVKTVKANTTTTTISPRPRTGTEYRVYALTDALGATQPDNETPGAGTGRKGPSVYKAPTSGGGGEGGGTGGGTVTLTGYSVTSWSWSAACPEDPTIRGGGSGFASRAAAFAAGVAWDKANCELFSRVDTSSSTYAVYGYAARCARGGATKSASGYSTAAAATSAGNAWVKANCPGTPTPVKPPARTGGTYTTASYLYRGANNFYAIRWSWGASCNSGSGSGSGTNLASNAAAVAAATSWITTNCR